MDPQKDIYHKADPSIPPRRKGRTFGRPFTGSAPQPTPASTLPGATPVGTQNIGAPISPVQIARQQMQMNPGGHLRRRRRRNREEHGSRRYNRIVWILVILVVAAYLAVLGVKLFNNWRNPKPAAPPKTASGTAVKPAAPAADPGAPADNGLPASERVKKWDKGLRALEEARTLANSGKINPARERYKLAAESLPNSTEQLLGNAKISYAERDFATAERLLLRVVEADPASTDARELLARTLFENARYVDALAVAEWICKLDPYSESAHDTAASAALTPQINDLVKAIDHLKKLSTLKSDDLTVKNNLGKAYLRSGDIAGARRIYEDMLNADDLNSAAHYQLAICQVKQDKPDEAIATLNRAATKLDINFVSTWLSSSDFTALHAHPDFIALQRRLGGGTNPAVPEKAP